MSEKDILASLKICSDMAECDGCKYKPSMGDCRVHLMKAAHNIIGFQHEQIVQASEAIEKLTKDNDNLYAMVSRKYTDEQLVQAVNNIIATLKGCINEEDHLERQLSAIGDFMKLCGIKGHIAVDREVERMEIFTG